MNNLERYLGRDGIVAAKVLWTAEAGLTEFSYGTANDGNVWLHFFKQLPFAAYPADEFEVREYPDPRPTYITGQEVYSTYKTSLFWRRRYHDLFSKYISLQPFLSARIEKIYAEKMSGNYCLGVHYRHPQHAGECINPMPSPEEFIHRVRRLMPSGKKCMIFLASDYEPAVQAFRTSFGDALVVQPNVSRSESATAQIHETTVNPALALGEEVLVDCLLLSKCDVMVHVSSNVATTAGYINPQLKMVYCETRAQALKGFLYAVRKTMILRLPVVNKLSRAYLNLLSPKPSRR